ncbi:MAG: xanthine dehydrogenase family protein molybdopterin-binding subunit [Roseiarcus sp.]|jgi:xanthine dehydrogenase YagR molybdenum-binding subunit|uniref:xanthine dehydrogenase family protein molybdopterin-binding subunit n=1 Tax=Roseiarcus sp. TaxID=1969460 RepID=UPI003C21AFDB
MASDGATRDENFPIGIASVGVHEEPRRIPEGEPPALPVNAELAEIGKPRPRWNGRAKATGAIRYTVDVTPPGMLFGRILRSPLPHARVRSIDLSAARRLESVKAIVSAVNPDDSSGATVRYVGQPVVAVAAGSMAQAEEALKLIRVDYQPLPFVVDMDDALKAGAPKVYEAESPPQGGGAPGAAGPPLDGNARGPALASRGDVAQGFALAEVTLEGEYSTQVQTHCCMEPHGLVADWRDDGLTVHISTQFTAGVRRELAQAFDLPIDKVRVVVDGMGGGFGSKSTLGNYGRLAVALSRQAGAPVRLTLTRPEEQMDSGNRPSVRQRIRLGASRDGTLTAMAIESHGTAGVGLGAGVGNFAQAIYDCANFSSAQYDVFINAGPGSAMRAPGNTPGAWGLESAIDELAEKLGVDPLALRDRIDRSPARREERRIGAERIGWSRRHAPGADLGPVKRGLGMAQSLWGANVQTAASIAVRLRRDGVVEAFSSVQDIGSGIGTVIQQTIAETLGLQPSQIVIHIGDTNFPAGPPSYGSRTTASITPPARVAAWKILQALFAKAAPALSAGPDDLLARGGLIETRSEPKRSMGFAEAAALIDGDMLSVTETRSEDYGGFKRTMGEAALAQQDLGGVQFAEVAVDVETGIIRVERVVAAQDCGRPLNPLLLESQIQGGVLMGVSYALYEERILDRATGRMVNANLEQYKVAGPREVPQIDVAVIENYQGRSATDAYGIAEPANIATAPAIGNAVYNAIGVRLRALPMTPAVVLAALGRTPPRG